VFQSHCLTVKWVHVEVFWPEATEQTDMFCLTHVPRMLVAFERRTRTLQI